MEIPMRKNRVISTQEYSGKVYCAQMDPWHTLVTRRKDATLIIGNCSGDRAGASRYIYARLSEYALACFFEDWKDSVVDTEFVRSKKKPSFYQFVPFKMAQLMYQISFDSVIFSAFLQKPYYRVVGIRGDYYELIILQNVLKGFGDAVLIQW